MGSLKKLLKSVDDNAKFNVWRNAWMDEKYKLHPDLDMFDVNVMYAAEVNVAAIAAGVHPSCKYWK